MGRADRGVGWGHCSCAAELAEDREGLRKENTLDLKS